MPTQTIPIYVPDKLYPKYLKIKKQLQEEIKQLVKEKLK